MLLIKLCSTNEIRFAAVKKANVVNRRIATTEKMPQSLEAQTQSF